MFFKSSKMTIVPYIAFLLIQSAFIIGEAAASPLAARHEKPTMKPMASDDQSVTDQPTTSDNLEMILKKYLRLTVLDLGRMTQAQQCNTTSCLKIQEFYSRRLQRWLRILYQAKYLSMCAQSAYALDMCKQNLDLYKNRQKILASNLQKDSEDLEFDE